MSISVYERRPDGQMIDAVRTEDPVEAEAHYLRLVQRRIDAPSAIVLAARAHPLVRPAQYRIDRDWPADAPREHDSQRHRQLWAAPPEWTGPTPHQLRGLVSASGLSGAEIARRIDVTPRQWRRWLSDDPSTTSIPYAAWTAALRAAELLPGVVAPGEVDVEEPDDDEMVRLTIRVTKRERDLIMRAAKGEGGVSEVVRYAAVHEACTLLGIDPDEWYEQEDERA